MNVIVYMHTVEVACTPFGFKNTDEKFQTLRLNSEFISLKKSTFLIIKHFFHTPLENFHYTNRLRLKNGHGKISLPLDPHSRPSFSLLQFPPHYSTNNRRKRCRGRRWIPLPQSGGSHSDQFNTSFTKRLAIKSTVALFEGREEEQRGT